MMEGGRTHTKSARRLALEAEGIRFIDAREWLIKKLLLASFYVDADIALALIRDLGKAHWGDDEIIP